MSQLQTIFISSSGRSGTKSLYEALATLPNVGAFHGPKPRVERENCAKYLGYRPNTQVAHLVRSRKALIDRVHDSGRHYVECAWYLTAFTEDLEKVNTECKVVHLVRDGRDFVRSGMARPWYEGEKTVYYNTIHAWSRDKFGKPPEGCDERFSKICWLWAEQQRVITRGMERLKSVNNGGVIRMEDFVGKEDISSWIRGLGIEIPLGFNSPIPMPKANSTPKHSILHWTSWTQKQVEIAKQWMGNELTQFGYEW